MLLSWSAGAGQCSHKLSRAEELQRLLQLRLALLERLQSLSDEQLAAERQLAIVERSLHAVRNEEALETLYAAAPAAEDNLGWQLPPIVASAHMQRVAFETFADLLAAAAQSAPAPNVPSGAAAILADPNRRALFFERVCSMADAFFTTEGGERLRGGLQASASEADTVVAPRERSRAGSSAAAPLSPDRRQALGTASPDSEAQRSSTPQLVDVVLTPEASEDLREERSSPVTPLARSPAPQRRAPSASSTPSGQPQPASRVASP